MKTNPVSFITFLGMLLALGCSSSRPLQHFVISPLAQPFPEKKDTPLYIVLNVEIPDALTLGTEGPSKLKVREFRMSLQDALSATFTKNFRTIYFVDTAPGQGLSLDIRAITARWKFLRESSSIVGDDEAQPFKTVFDIQATLYSQGSTLQTASFQSEGETNWEPRSKAQAFKDGLRISCEDLSRNIFPDRIVSQLK